MQPKHKWHYNIIDCANIFSQYSWSCRSYPTATNRWNDCRRTTEPTSWWGCCNIGRCTSFHSQYRIWISILPDWSILGQRGEGAQKQRTRCPWAKPCDWCQADDMLIILWRAYIRLHSWKLIPQKTRDRTYSKQQQATFAPRTYAEYFVRWSTFIDSRQLEKLEREQWDGVSYLRSTYHAIGVKRLSHKVSLINVVLFIFIANCHYIQIMSSATVWNELWQQREESKTSYKSRLYAKKYKSCSQRYLQLKLCWNLSITWWYYIDTTTISKKIYSPELQTWGASDLVRVGR